MRCKKCEEATRKRREAYNKTVNNALIYAKTNGLSEIVVFTTQGKKFGYCRPSDQRMSAFSTVELISLG